MNPFTRFLSQWNKDRPLQTFIAHWDAVEALAIHVYKTKDASEADEGQYQKARTALLELYPQIAVALRPYWQESLVGGTADHVDPFQYVLAPEHAAGYIDN